MSSNKKRLNNKLKKIQNEKIEKQIIDVKINHLNQKILINKLKFMFTVLVIIFFSIWTLYFSLLKPTIVLNGEKNLIIDVNSEYKEIGYKAKYLGKDISDTVTVKTNLDTKKIGNYRIEYQVNYGGKIKKTVRNIQVKDKIRPNIEINGSQELYICPNHEYQELGYKAIDNYDGDITNKVKVVNDGSEIVYEVKDSSYNKTSVIRKIIKKDIEKPIINLNGEKEITIYLGNEYQELGYTVSDNCDLDITNKVEIESNLIVNKVGTYKISYKVRDNSGNQTIIDRIIKVVDPLSTGKVIYLTFDDGPSPITSGILDILKEENVKATFFVTGNVNYYPNILKREVEEGHTIALHTFTHDYKTVYNSIESYFNDLNMIRDAVYSITGRYSNIIRFPGGSSNTISRNYQKGIMTNLSTEVEKKGFIYFDWNVSSEDAGSARNSVQVYNNVINNLKYKNNIVLLHDFGGNYKTLNALRDIIKYGKNNGYTFDVINQYTDAVHHRINN